MELQTWGLSRTDIAESDVVEIWPDNWDVIGLFAALNTQWRVGFSGATGLDYGVLPSVLRMRGIPRARWPDLFDDLRVLEAEALTAMNEE